MVRPIRDRFEKATEKIPEGPMGKIGSGDVIGAGGYVAVESTRPLIDFIPGITQPGYKITAHSTNRLNNGTRHNVTVAAVSRNVAEFAAEYNAAPSNIDYFTSDTEIVNVELLEEQRAYSIWKITVDVMDVEGMR